MRYSVLLLGLSALFAFVSTSSAQAPAGWQTVSEPKLGCRVSVPQDWKINAKVPTRAYAPDDKGALNLLGRPGQPQRTISQASQQVLSVAKIAASLN